MIRHCQYYGSDVIAIMEDLGKNVLTKVIIVMHSNVLCHLKHSLLFVEAIIVS